MVRPIKALVLDLDGTLLNTLEGLANSFNRALSSLGMQTRAVDEYRHFIGDGAARCASRCLPDEHSNNASLIETCVSLFQSDYADSWREGTEPYPGITDLLAGLGQHHMPLTVLSNKDDAFTQEMVTVCFPETRFSLVAGFGYQHRVLHKPDPSGPLLIAEHLQLPTEALAMVGDTATDIQTAHTSGMVSIGVLWGFRDRQELEQAGAQHVIGSPPELMELI